MYITLYFILYVTLFYNEHDDQLLQIMVLLPIAIGLCPQ
jgi:hypothetical protein